MRVANCVKGSSPVAIYAALFFDPRGRPGPRRRLRWRRPFVARVGVEKLPSNDCIAARTSCCTSSRITVNKLLCLGINASLVAADTRRRPPGKGSSICLASSGESCWRCSGGTPAFRQIGTRGADTCGYAECAVGAVWRAPAGRAVVGACISCAPRSGAADDAPLLRRAISCRARLQAQRYGRSRVTRVRSGGLRQTLGKRARCCCSGRWSCRTWSSRRPPRPWIGRSW